jgi:hypothetical protein
MSDITFVPAWGLKDSKIVADTQELWRRLDVLQPAEIDRRVSELVAAAYIDDRMVGVSSTSFSYIKALKGRFAMYRTSVAPDARRQHVSYRLAAYSRDVLEKWSEEHPREQVLGMAALIEAKEYVEKQREPIWPEWGLNLNFVGFSENGRQLRVSWFKHAKL